LANVAGIQKGSVFQTHSVHNTTWNMTVTVNFFANLVLQWYCCRRHNRWNWSVHL